MTEISQIELSPDFSFEVDGRECLVCGNFHEFGL